VHLRSLPIENIDRYMKNWCQTRTYSNEEETVNYSDRPWGFMDN